MSEINFPARDEEAIALLKSDPDAYFAKRRAQLKKLDHDRATARDRAMAPIAAYPKHLRAAVRLLTERGDITPMGARVLNNIANQWEGK